MRVLLASPFYDLTRKTYGFDAAADVGYGPPMGIAYLAAVLRRAGHEVFIHDPPPGERYEDDVVDAALDLQPDVVGLSVISCLYPQAATIARGLKRRRPGTPVIIGGPHSSCDPIAPLLDCPEIDVSVAGEAEDRIVALVEGTGSPEALSRIPGICHRKDGGIERTAALTDHPSLDELPRPARDLLATRIGRNQPYQQDTGKSTWVIASRGCPHGRCTFCFYSHDGAPPYRRRSPSDVVDEVEELVRHQGFEHVSFLDEDFVGDRAWVERVCEEIVGRGLRFEWYCETRVTAVTTDLLRKMREAGCYLVYFGIEAGHPELLRMIRKGITIERAKEAVRLAREAGIQVVTSFIIGLPKETPEMGLQTIQTALELDPDYAVFHYYHPARGLPINEHALADGELLAFDHPDFARVNYVPGGYGSVEEVERMLALAYRRFFLRPRYIGRHLARLRGFDDLKRAVLGALIALSRAGVAPALGTAGRLLAPLGRLGGGDRA